MLSPLLIKWLGSWRRRRCRCLPCAQHLHVPPLAGAGDEAAAKSIQLDGGTAGPWGEAKHVTQTA